MTQLAGGIYAIVNRIDGKRYIGSTVCFRDRWATHKRELNDGTHHCKRLLRAWRTCGPDTFDFTVIEAVADSMDIVGIRKLEQRYINEFKAVSYNTLKRASYAVVQHGVNGEEIARYGTVRDAERSTGVDYRSIISVCRSRRKRGAAGGFIWSYVVS